MITATVKLTGTSPLSQGRHIQSPKGDKESFDAYEHRTWRERLHVNEQGDVFVPPMALKNGLDAAAKQLSIKIKGRGQATYTKHFERGVMVVDPMNLGVPAAEVPGETLFVPSDGKKGGSSRVMKTFPVINEWEGTAKFTIMDETITPEIFSKTLVACGQYIGLGRFRPANGGWYGRFKVEEIIWEENDLSTEYEPTIKKIAG